MTWCLLRTAGGSGLTYCIRAWRVGKHAARAWRCSSAVLAELLSFKAPPWMLYVVLL
jgi:hypothetical protein